MVKLPVCFEPRSAATALRATLERLEWEYTRSDDVRTFTQVALVIPFQRAAHLFRYEIPHGDLLLELWAAPTHRPRPGNGQPRPASR